MAVTYTTAVKNARLDAVTTQMGTAAKVGSIQLTRGELDLVRQWYNAVQDMAPQYLAGADHALGEKIRRACA